MRRGLIRYVQLVLDFSRASAANDMRPTRLAVMSGVAQQFIRAFFDENPLSQLGIVLMRNGVAEQLSEMSSSPVRFFSSRFSLSYVSRQTLAAAAAKQPARNSSHSMPTVPAQRS